MPRLPFNIEDSAQPLVMQLGTPRAPFDLTGHTAQIILRDVATNTRITAGTTVIQTPPTAGRVQRVFETAELVLGKVYVVECIVDPPNGQTYPDRQQQPLEVEMTSRRTSPVP